MKNYFGKISNQHGGVKRYPGEPNKFWLSGIFRDESGTAKPIAGRTFANLVEVIDENDARISHFYKLDA